MLSPESVASGRSGKSGGAIHVFGSVFSIRIFNLLSINNTWFAVLLYFNRPVRTFEVLSRLFRDPLSKALSMPK